MSMKQTLLKYLSDGDYEKTLDVLKTIFEKAGDDTRARDTVLLRSRYNQVSADERRGVISYEEGLREKNRIAAALADMIAKIPASATLPDGSATTDTNTGKDPAPAHQAGGRLPLYIGAGALLVAVLLIILFPCPSGMQFFVIRALTALGVAGLAYFLSGTLNLNLSEGIKASGSLAVLVLLYLINPAGGLVGQDCVTEVPVTVFVHGSEGRQDLVLRQQGHVLMDYRGERKRQAISENGEAFFNNLRVGDTIHLNVDFSEPYKAVRPDSAYTIDRSGKIYLEVALQHLDKVFGRAIFDNQPLPGVVVSIGATLRDTTDELGNYEIKIPRALQKKEQEVTFFKKGFDLLTKKAFPQTNEPLSVVMQK